MDGTQFATAAYIIGLGLMWGYVLSLFLAGRRLSRQEANGGFASTSDGERA